MTAQQKRHQKIRVLSNRFITIIPTLSGCQLELIDSDAKRDKKGQGNFLVMHSRPLINVAKEYLGADHLTFEEGGGGGGGMGELVWVRIFSKPLEIESPYIIFQH